MATFKQIKISWRGRDYVIPANRVLGAVAVIEEHVTLPELQRYFAAKGMPVARLSMAYAAALEYAGAQGVSADDVYAAWFSGADNSREVLEGVMGVMAMMIPPDHLGGAGAGGPPKGPPVGGAPAARKKSSSRRATAR